MFPRHVDERLEQRVVPAVAERAYLMLREKECLIQWLEALGKDQGLWAKHDRVALALEPGPAPAHLLVNRGGCGITCLASGMQQDLPTVPWVQVERLLQALSERMSEITALGSLDREGRHAMDRLVKHPFRLTRADHDLLRPLAPLLVEVMQKAVEVGLGVVDRCLNSRWDKHAPDTITKPAWQLYGTGMMALMAGGHLRELDRYVLTASMKGDVLLATRGMWWCINMPQRFMDQAESLLDALNHGPHAEHWRPDLTADDANHAFQGPLRVLAFRFPFLRGRATSLLLELGKQLGRLEDMRALVERDKDGGLLRKLLMFRVLLELLERCNPPDKFWSSPSANTQAARDAIDAGERDLCKVAALVSPWHAELAELWDPLRDLPVPVPHEPVPPRLLTEQDRLRVELWRNILRDWSDSPSGPRNYDLAALLSLAPVEALLPAEAPEECYTTRNGMEYMRRVLPGILGLDKAREPVRKEPRQQPNQPCACGSGVKFKRCCGAVNAKLPA